MKKTEHRIKTVSDDGIAMEMGVEPGMILTAINGEPVRDILDYRFRMSEEHVDVTIRDLQGEETVLSIDKDPDEDFGVEFDTPFMDDYRRCSNRCIFCFIDQMPKGMRDTLYFKDDDARLSFLQGNYVTLTNLSDEDVERICRYKMEPINISVHTTNPALRNKMLGNRFAGDALKKLDTFQKAGIVMNGQIVLCRGINDQEELDRTLADLIKYRPEMQSVSVVPVGLTRYRSGLADLRSFDREEARRVIRQIGHYRHFAYASDEWFLLADEKIPKAGYYDGYPQIENGVGMLRSLWDEVEEAVAKEKEEGPRPVVSAACGMLFLPYFRRIAAMLPNCDLRVYGITNRFFGEGVTVSGLLTGQDILQQLQGRELGERLLLSVNMLRSGESVFLDDMTVPELEEKLGVPIVVTGQSGYDLVNAAEGRTDSFHFEERQVYEP